MFELKETTIRSMNGKEFRAWCERQGMSVVHVRRSPRGALRAYLLHEYGKGRATVAELSLDGRRVYLRRVNETGREILVNTWEA